MKTVTVLFTYNRSYHTEQVINAIKKSTVLPEKLLIFQDGPKKEDDLKEWKKVNRLINSIDWCEKEVFAAEENRGLAASILSGVNYAFEEHEAVIVLEDDCVPSSDFISFMNQCFDKYNGDKRVYSISGYSWPIALERRQYDVYGCGRISSWGWGTWKDRWNQYKADSDILKSLKGGQQESIRLAIWGNDCETMLLGNITGKNDSWGVYWALYVIAKGGICINPYKSLIQNIGMDGTGVHCGISHKFGSQLSNEQNNSFVLPDNIDIQDDTKREFAALYGGYTAVNTEDISKTNVLIYGLGNFYARYEKEINRDYNVKAFIDNGKKGWYAGKKIIGCKDVSKYNYDSILVMVQDIQECINISNELIRNKVNADKIILGHSQYGEYSNRIDRIAISPHGKLLLTFGNISLGITSKDEFNNVCEVFLGQNYNYAINNGEADIVLDIGMNIGDSTLYFLHHANVEKVYAYEPFYKTFYAAKENLREFLKVPGKLEIFQYGISSENAQRTIGFNNNMTCGQSSIANIREQSYEFYLNEGLIKQNEEEREQIEVKKASEVFKPIIERYPNHNIVLKMNCEGEEYYILEELLETGLLDKMTFIMLEWHYRGKDLILGYLKKAGFSWWCNDKSEDLGFIYGYRYS